MAANHHLLNQEDEEDDYIDMEVSSTSNFFCYPKSTSPQHTNDFEFQMFSSSSDRKTTSPADELFYKGKLLPLHLPPRLQMFEKLLQNSSPYMKSTLNYENEHFNPSLTTTAYTTPAENTPFDSCNISPSESPKLSKELEPDEYISHCSTEAVSFSSENPKKSWAKKLKLGSKLKASHAYLKSFFNKPSSSYLSSAGENWNELAPKTAKASPKERTPFGQIQREKYQMSIIVSSSFKKEKAVPDGMAPHRRSFSGAIRGFSKTKPLLLSQSSSSFELSSSLNSANLIGSTDSSFLRRSGSVRSDIESSIQGAIAHCKSSQQDFLSRKTAIQVGLNNLSTFSLLGCEVQGRPVLCRG